MKNSETSPVWKHIIKTLEKLKCIYCPKEFSLKTSTGVMMKHIEKYHEEKLETKEPSPKKKKMTISDEKSLEIHGSLMKTLLKLVCV